MIMRFQMQLTGFTALLTVVLGGLVVNEFRQQILPAPEGAGANKGVVTRQILNNTPVQLNVVTKDSTSTKMTLVVTGVTPFDYRVMPRDMSYYASYPVGSGEKDPLHDDPHDTSLYTVDYGDGTIGRMRFQGVSCPVEGEGSCTADWWAPSHSFATPGTYTAILYKNSIQIVMQKFTIIRVME